LEGDFLEIDFVPAAIVSSPSHACRRANGAAPRTTNAIERLHEEFKRRIKT
jgi:transposase-like protein